MLTTETVLRRNVVPGAISKPEEVSHYVASQKTYKGEQVTMQRFGAVAETGARADLTGNLRAFQIQGDGNQTLAGTLKDGDHVDVVASLTYKWSDFHPHSGSTNSDTLSASRVVLRDIKVLKAPGAPAPGSKLTGAVDQRYPVLLLVTDSQAQKLLFITANSGNAASGSQWALELRPVVHAADSPDHVDRVSTILMDGLSPQERQALAP
jgi:Flp pilus assembly protein CpaB